MSFTWEEVEQALEEKRCELILSGPLFSKRIEETGLDGTIFKIKSLNFLEISKTCLTHLPDDIGQLGNLTRLVLCNNDLQSVTKNIGKLTKLKFLDTSFNKISSLPDEVSSLLHLQSLNVSNNKLSSIPSLKNLSNLVTLNFAHNEFTEFPSSVCEQNLPHLSEIIANNNKILDIPSEIRVLGALKILDLGDNDISSLPGELGDCTKLKEMNLKGNKLKDKRLLKLVEQCHVKQVMEYIRSHCPKANVVEDGKQGKSKKKVKQSKKLPGNDEIGQLQDQIRVLHVKDETIKVISYPKIHDIRPYIVCCIVHNVTFKKENMFKKFITLQTKLHDTVCEKRTAATIATHDLSKINGNLSYDAKAPGEIKIIPLGKKKEMTATELYTSLNEEAEALRKEKKKNTYSGIHKYLYLLKDKPLYPCLMDDSGLVVSFPPITNSDGTKISDGTKSILLEVTGNLLTSCKKVMDTLLQEMLKLGIGEQEPVVDGNGETGESQQFHLLVEQVKVVDEEGQLKVVYPSRTDIQVDGISVIRS